MLYAYFIICFILNPHKEKNEEKFFHFIFLIYKKINELQFFFKMKKNSINSREDLIKQTQEILKSKGVENQIKARYANEVSKEICGNSKPIFSQMQPSIRETKGKSWGMAYALVLTYLQNNKSNLTLECLQREIDRSKVQITPISPKISLENVQKLQKEDFQTKVMNFAKQLEKKEEDKHISNSSEDIQFYSSSTQPEKSDAFEAEKSDHIQEEAKISQHNEENLNQNQNENNDDFDDIDFEIGGSSDGKDKAPQKEQNEQKNGSSISDIDFEIDDDDNDNKVNLLQKEEKQDNIDDDSFDISDDAFAVEAPKQTETISDRLETNNQNTDSINFELDDDDPFNDSDSGF